MLKRFIIKLPSMNLLYVLLICYITFFFPIISMINQFSDQETNVISLIYRVSTFLLSVFIILREILLRKKIVFPYSMYLIILFWIFYLVHLIYDLYVLGLILDPLKTREYYLGQAVGICFINMLACYHAGRKIDFTLLAKAMFILFSIINVLLIVNFLNSYGLNFIDYAKTRYTLTSEVTDIEYLNPISIGVNSGYLLILMMYVNKIKIYHLILIPIGLFNLIISASMGPFLSLGMVVILFTFLKFRSLNIKKVLMLGIMVLTVFIVYYYYSGVMEDFLLYERLMNSDTETVTSTTMRLESINYAFDQIKSNVIFGTHYYVLADRSSPHNIFVDIILVSGLVGLFLFICPLIKFLSIIFHNYLKNPIMAIAFFTFGLAQTSGYVHGLDQFWPLMALVLAFSVNLKKARKKCFLKNTSSDTI